MKTSDLKHLAGGADRHAADAAARLPDLAAANDLLDVAFGTVASPIGELLVAVTPRGLARVAFDDEDADQVIRALSSSISPRVLRSSRATDEVRRELDEYFDQRRTRFDVHVDRRLVHGIARDVLAQTSRIPYGRTSTYGEIAGRIGKPRAARAVGNALGSNPIPIVIPCHRVLRAGGALGGYGGGVDRKETLLALEGAMLA